jgi:hypothetical protein
MIIINELIAISLVFQLPFLRLDIVHLQKLRFISSKNMFDEEISLEKDPTPLATGASGWPWLVMNLDRRAVAEQPVVWLQNVCQVGT